ERVTMDLEGLIARIDDLEDQNTSLYKSLTTLNSKVNEVDERTASFLELIRDEKKEVSRLNTIVLGLGQFDSAITQIRVDFNKRFDDLQKRINQERKLRADLVTEDLKSINARIVKIKTELTNEFDQKLAQSLEENERFINRFKDIEEDYRKNVNISEFKTLINTINQDLQRTMKQVENLQAEMQAKSELQEKLRSKLDVVTDTLRTNESRLNEIIATESERRQIQLDFLEKQSLIQKDRDRIWNEWSQQFEEFSKEIYGLLPEIHNQQLGLKRTQKNFDEITQQFDRRIKEITEIYRLMDEKFRKEWETFKSDSEKRWANISLVIDDKRGGYSEQFQSLKERMVFIEDNTHEMQEVLLLMSTEIQKGMQNIMKMVNGWMDAFGQIKTTK
ncbi:MAG: hypothetical protein J7L73_08160, partial [Anaerolineales bacterium]|nr:hypothetical protein [Anaerolineales bacterium]